MPKAVDSPAPLPVKRGNPHSILWARGGFALLGGYAVAAAWAAALARLLPGAAADTALIATMLSFLVYTGAAVWSFAAPTTARAAIGLLLSGSLGIAVAWLLRGASA